MNALRCPDWCGSGHHCTALSSPAGEHSSYPEIWRTDRGRLIATRHRDAHTGADWIELRSVVALDPAEEVAQAQARHLIAVSYLVLDRAFSASPQPEPKSNKQKGHLR
ncbi:MAG TPA: hypothetical protein DGT23_26895 [Micromonosporaceae bacterium]|nr:hypothetical protein [Micromonosporaceae bacterium]